MQQRARLKALDRFKSDPNAILVATDVAARGLDVKDVRYGRAPTPSLLPYHTEGALGSLTWLLRSWVPGLWDQVVCEGCVRHRKPNFVPFG